MSMTIKTILYIITVPFVIWALDSVQINQIFKKNRIIQARIFYLILTFSLSYLTVNLFYDFFLYTKII